MKRNLKLALIGSALVLAQLAAPSISSAVITVYTNQATWQAAAGASTVETFSAAPVGNFAGPAFGPINFMNFSLSGVTNGDTIGITTTGVANSGDNSPIPGSFTGQNFVAWGNGTGAGSGDAGPTTTLTFTQPTTAFAFDWFNTDPSDQYQITLSPAASTFSAPPFTVTPNSGPATSGFWGVVATGGETVSFATISTQFFGGYISGEGFDNVRVASPIPEPATACAGLALLGVCVSQRRRR